MKLTKTRLKQIIQEELTTLLEVREKDPGAEVRNRGDVVFPAESEKVTDDEDHFPINSLAQARNALARASQYDSPPNWYKGGLEDLVKTVQRKVHAKYPSIEITKKSATPGKD